MKNEKNQNRTEKRSVEDFAHRVTVQLQEKHYVDYALTHSQDQIKNDRKKAIMWAALFFVLGAIALYKGTTMEGRLSDIYLTAGILMIVFQLFNLFYNFVMFPIALKRSVLKELKRDPSLLSPMVYAFEPDKLVCFIDGRHRSTILTQDISGVEETADTTILEVKNGKRVILPQEILAQAEPYIQQQIKSFQKK